MKEASANDWLPPGKHAAVCLTVDDVHPAPAAAASLDCLRDLQRRHPELRATLFTTPDWRSLEPYPTGLRARMPIVRSFVHTVPVLGRPSYRLDRHPEFCARLRAWPGIEIAHHGLRHVRRGRQPIVEFHGRSRRACRSILRRAGRIFASADLDIAPGLSPPGWYAPPELLEAMADLDLRYLCSARDLDTPISPGAVAAGSGLRGVPLVRPVRLPGGIVHISTNFQATSELERALAIIGAGGLLAIKAHVPGGTGRHKMLDELNAGYCDHLDQVLAAIKAAAGDTLWWASAGEIAAKMLS